MRAITRFEIPSQGAAEAQVTTPKNSGDLPRVEQQLGELQSKLARMEQDRAALDLSAVGKALDEATRAAEEARSAANAAKAAAGLAAVASYSGFYKARAVAHEGAAARWMWVTVAAAVAVTVAALAFIGMALAGLRPAGNDLAGAIEYVTLRVVAISGLIALAYWSSGQMRAHQHNAVVNRQKEAGVNTFQAFAKEAEHDPEARRVVIMEAARSIYSVQDTGWGGSAQAAYQTPLMQVVTAADAVRGARKAADAAPGDGA